MNYRPSIIRVHNRDMVLNRSIKVKTQFIAPPHIANEPQAHKVKHKRYSIQYYSLAA